MQLSGKRVLVTGGGRAMALAFAAEGAAVCVTARRADQLDEVVDTITTAGGVAMRSARAIPGHATARRPHGAVV